MSCWSTGATAIRVVLRPIDASSSSRVSCWSLPALRNNPQRCSGDVASAQGRSLQKKKKKKKKQKKKKKKKKNNSAPQSTRPGRSFPIPRAGADVAIPRTRWEFTPARSGPPVATLLPSVGYMQPWATGDRIEPPLTFSLGVLLAALGWLRLSRTSSRSRASRARVPSDRDRATDRGSVERDLPNGSTTRSMSACGAGRDPSRICAAPPRVEDAFRAPDPRDHRVGSRTTHARASRTYVKALLDDIPHAHDHSSRDVMPKLVTKGSRTRRRCCSGTLAGTGSSELGRRAHAWFVLQRCARSPCWDSRRVALARGGPPCAVSLPALSATCGGASQRPDAREAARRCASLAAPSRTPAPAQIGARRVEDGCHRVEERGRDEDRGERRAQPRRQRGLEQSRGRRAPSERPAHASTRPRARRAGRARAMCASSLCAPRRGARAAPTPRRRRGQRAPRRTPRKDLRPHASGTSGAAAKP